jgi:hypothetical protein
MGKKKNTVSLPSYFFGQNKNSMKEIFNAYPGGFVASPL